MSTPKKSKKKKGQKRFVKSASKGSHNKSFWRNSTNLLCVAVALIVTFGCFWNTTQNEFVNWDDDRNFYENPLVTTINGDNFWGHTKQIFSSPVIGNYNPLTIWTFAIEKMVYGLDDPGKWHWTNLMLHLICVLLVLRIALLLGLKWQGALFVALLFGIHPMRVESVAWVTERKDVLFGLFYLAGMYYYIKHKLKAKKKYVVLIMLCFILSLFSKIQAVILPLSLLAIDYYLDGKWNRKNWMLIGSMLLLSLIFGIIGLMYLGDQGSLESNTSFPLWQRIFIGSFSYCIYLIKWIVPYKLSPLYPYPSSIPVIFYVSIAIVPIMLGAFYYVWKKQAKAIVFGLIFFTINIVFLLQILGAGQGFVADRFTYIAYFGLFFILGYYLDYLLERKVKLKLAILGISMAYLMVLGYITINQNMVWKNSGTLWSHVLKYYQNATLPYGNRANYYRDNGLIKPALLDYNKSISLKPNQPQALNSRARLFFEVGKTRDTLMLAIRDYNAAIELEPNNGEFYVNRGAAYAKLGDANNAIADMTKGLNLKPDHAVGYLNRFLMYSGTGQAQLALQDAEQYSRMRPYESDMYYEIARLKRLLNRPQEAIQDYNKAINMNPQKGLYYYERSRTYFSLNKLNEARADLQRAINLRYDKIDPSYRQQMNI